MHLFQILVILDFSFKLSVGLGMGFMEQDVPTRPHFDFSLACFSHLAAMAHKTLQVKDSPPDVAGVCYFD